MVTTPEPGFVRSNPTKPMAKSVPKRKECIARTDKHHRFGIDAESRTHYQDAQLGAVWVTHEGDLVHIQPEADLRSWVHFVCEEIGWESLSYSEQSTATWLTDCIEGAV